MKISVYDKNLTRILIIDNQFVSCLWAEGYNTTEQFVLELQNSDTYKTKIRPDCYVGRADRNTLMVIKTVEFRDGLIIVTGFTADRVLEDVAFVGTIPENQQIPATVKAAYDDSTKYRLLEFAPSELTTKYAHQISHKSFSELCHTMAQETNLGFRVVKSGGGLLAEFYQGQIRSNAIFAEKYGNLATESIILSSEVEKNVAIVLGQGEGDARVRVTVDLSGGSDKKELIVEASDLQQEENETASQYQARLRARGVEQLLLQKATQECALLVRESDFGTRFDLGDIVTVLLTDYGLKFTAKIARFSQKEQANQTETVVEVGEITILR